MTFQPAEAGKLKKKKILKKLMKLLKHGNLLQLNHIFTVWTRIKGIQGLHLVIVTTLQIWKELKTIVKFKSRARLKFNNANYYN